MDYLQKIIALCLLAFVSMPASANFPAKIAPNTYCYSSSSSYSCVGPTFSGPSDAANYACQRWLGYMSATAVEVKSMPVNMSQGLSPWGSFGWRVQCSLDGYLYGTNEYMVQAAASCNGGYPITNYSPATCAGTPAEQPPLACSSTANLVISAYHQVPVSYLGCYAGCSYSATVTDVVEYNGVQYESGTWTGAGTTCENTDVRLNGGSPGNTQSVGTGGGLVPSDLANLATEHTLQQLLQTIRDGDTSSGTIATANKALLEKIEANTASSGSPISDDNEAFEAEFRQKVAATPTTHGGALDALPSENIDVTNTFTNVNGFLNASCPALPSFTVLGKSYSFDLSLLCQLAVSISYLVVTLAAITGVKIFIGGIK